ncbi:MAG: alanine racemase [Synechococcaceae cyanobacterium]|jgi:alanine racemase
MSTGPPAPEPTADERGQSRRRAWVEIHHGAIRANARAIRDHIGPDAALMAVVKADGYGHGAVEVSRAALAGGASSFGVATLAEGVELRRAGITAPVLVLGNLTDPEELRGCLRWQLMPTVSTLEQARLCQDLAGDSGRRLAIQLKLDTGMTRLGADWQEAPRLVAAIHGLDALALRGVYTHLASADLPPGCDEGLTARQRHRFFTVLNALQQQGLATGCRHLANSAGMLLGQEHHLDMVRVGLALYGHAPAPHLNHLPLQPALGLQARVSLIRRVGAGVGVSYGHRFRTSRASRLAVLSIGYADGVPRLLSNRLEVLWGSRRLPQVGAITMDQMVIDASEAPDLEVGSVVTLLGRHGSERIGPDDWATLIGTIPWEILCGFKHRLPRLTAAESGGGGGATAGGPMPPPR